MPAEVYKGNRCEIPHDPRGIYSDMPLGFWALQVRKYHQDPHTQMMMIEQVPWHHPMLEYLDPRRLAVVRAKARIWWEITGMLPNDSEVHKWWELRAARREGQVPLRQDVAISEIDENNILWCGECGSRYSSDRDGQHREERCNLCGMILIWRERST